MNKYYQTKRERITEFLKQLMKKYPKDPVFYEVFLSHVSYELSVSEKDIEPVVKTFINMGFFEIVGDTIISKAII